MAAVFLEPGVQGDSSVQDPRNGAILFRIARQTLELRLVQARHFRSCRSWRPAGWFRAFLVTARYPRINLHIKTGQSLANFKSDGVDIAIRFGTGDWKGLRAIKLLDEELFPVCSPSLNDGRLPKDPASMLSEPLLIDRNVSWRAWFRSAGVT